MGRALKSVRPLTCHQGGGRNGSREPLRHFSFIMTNPRGKIEFSGAGGRAAIKSGSSSSGSGRKALLADGAGAVSCTGKRPFSGCVK